MSAAKPRATAWSASTVSPDGQRVIPKRGWRAGAEDGYATTVCETATGCAVGLADGAAERRGAVWLAEIGAETSAFITGRATARTITLREKSPE